MLFYIHSKEHKSVGDGMIPKCTEWHRYIGMSYIWVFDTCGFGDLQDWLREEGEAVFGGCKQGDDLENNRQLGNKWFKQAGFHQPRSANFDSIDGTIDFVENNSNTKWILKQNGDLPKSISYATKFDGCVDLIHHLNELKRSWNEAEFGNFDCDLMEIVEGTELAVSAFFNGHQFMENSQGKVVGYLNFEEKKEVDGGLGETCGEMGTTFLGVTEDNKLFRNILLRSEISDRLTKIDFRGVFDINCIVSESGEITALEPTMRFGVPATSYEFIEGVIGDPAILIEAVANGLDKPIELFYGVGMVMCVVAKPFPLEVDVEDQGTSVGEKLWILQQDGTPRRNFLDSQELHIHPYNFKKTDEGDYKVATKNGHLLTVTRSGVSIKAVRNQLIEYIKANLYIRGMKWRSDIGKRVEEYVNEIV